MTLEAFGAWAQSRGYKWVGSNAYGVYHGYPFSAYLRTGKRSVLTVQFRVTKSLIGKAIRALQKTLPKGCSLVVGSQNLMTLTVSGTDETLDSQFQAAMDLTTHALADAGAAVPDKCPYCKQTGCDCLAAVGGGNSGKPNYSALAGGAVGVAVAQATAPASGYIPVHRACVESRAGEAAAKAEINTVSGSYVTGFLGALLGGIVGAIPTVLLCLTGYMAALLYALIPLAAYQGYKICQGKMNKGAFWCTLIVSVVMLFVIEQTVFYIVFVMELGYWPSALESVSIYFQLMEPADIAVDMVPSALFLLLGFCFAWGKVRRTAAHDVQDMTMALETLTPYRVYGDDDPQ